MALHGNSLLVISQFVFMGLSYLVHIVITRLLGPSEYGTWGVLLSLLSWFELSVMYGFPKWTIRFIAEETDESIQNRIKIVSIVGQAIVTLSMAILFLILALTYSKSIGDPVLFQLVIISSVDIVLYGMYMLNFSIINGKRHYVMMFWMTLLYAISKSGFIIAFVFLGFGLQGAAIGNVLSSLLVFAVSLFTIGRLSFKPHAKYNLKNFFRFGLPSTVFIILFFLLHQLDILFLKAFYSGEEVIGFYLIAILMARVPYFIVEATSKSLFAELSFRATRSKNLEISSIFNNYIYSTTILFALIVTISITGCKDLILIMFPDIYLESVSFLQLLIIANTFVGFSYLMSQTLFVYNKEKQASFLITAVLVISFPINYLLIKFMGPTGAAVSSLIVFIITTALVGISIKPFIKLKIPWQLCLKLIITSALTSVFMYLLNPDSFIGHLSKLTAGTLFFIISLIILKEPFIRTFLSSGLRMITSPFNAR